MHLGNINLNKVDLKNKCKIKIFSDKNIYTVLKSLNIIVQKRKSQWTFLRWGFPFQGCFSGGPYVVRVHCVVGKRLGIWAESSRVKLYVYPCIINVTLGMLLNFSMPQGFFCFVFWFCLLVFICKMWIITQLQKAIVKSEWICM